jgi:hypothetical protein
MSKSWKVLVVAGSGARLAYGLGAMLAPEWMDGRLAPTLQGHPDPRMNLRGFGGAQSAVAVYTLAMTRTREGARSALALNALVDGCDAVVSALEIRARGRVDRAGGGGVVLNVAGLACWAAAAALLRRG